MYDKNDLDGINTSGISMETFGGNNIHEQEDGIGSYADSWTSGNYTVQGYDNVEPTPMKREGRGLEIAALVFGILALIICCCNGFFGLIGLILSIIALAKGKKSGLSIAGLACSIMALLFAMSVVMFSATEAGQVFWESFEQGFMEGLEENYDADYDETKDSGNASADEELEEYTESAVESHEGTAVISNEAASKVIIEGNVITVPCQLSDVLKYYEVSEYSQEVMSGQLEEYDTEIIYLAENGVENGVYVVVNNFDEKTVSDMNKAKVECISIDNEGASPVGEVRIFNDITLNMTSEELENAIKDIKYNKSEMSGYLFYNMYVGDNNEYSVSLMLVDDQVANISISYMDY